MEQVIRAHAKARGESYRLRWDVETRGDTHLVSKAQPFRAPLIDGGEIELRLQEPTAVLLVFWASWCEPCREEAPHLMQLAQRFGDRIRLISVSIDEPEAIDALRSTVAKLGISYPVALDPGGNVILPKYARGVGIPLTFVIDGNGVVRYTQRNYQPGDEVALAKELEAALPKPKQ